MNENVYMILLECSLLVILLKQTHLHSRRVSKWESFVSNEWPLSIHWLRCNETASLHTHTTKVDGIEKERQVDREKKLLDWNKSEIIMSQYFYREARPPNHPRACISCIGRLFLTRTHTHTLNHALNHTLALKNSKIMSWAISVSRSPWSRPMKKKSTVQR